MTKRSIVPGEIEGFLSGCPFCTSHRIGIPDVGTRFRIISGFRAGDAGTVVNWPTTIEPLQHEFMAQIDSDPPNVQTRIILRKDLIEKLPSKPVPKWVPPLSMDDASKLDKAILYFCQKSFQNDKWKTDMGSFYEIIRVIWYFRLPIDSKELWSVLKAHGVPNQTKKIIIEFYEQGSNLVIYCLNKKFRKKKRIEALTE
ncbi:MAG: hypothetical protein WC855_12355 [Thermodesulfovibrionales bacterium]